MASLKLAILPCLLTAAVAANAAPPAADATGQKLLGPPQPATCWSVEGPFKDSHESYFVATSHCPEPMHCFVWVNAHEPPYQVHMESGTKQRIDVGILKADDHYTSECNEIS